MCPSWHAPLGLLSRLRRFRTTVWARTIGVREEPVPQRSEPRLVPAILVFLGSILAWSHILPPGHRGLSHLVEHGL